MTTSRSMRRIAGGLLALTAGVLVALLLSSSSSIRELGGVRLWRQYGASPLPIPVTRQTSWWDCGQAALANLLEATGHQGITVDSMLVLLPVKPAGTTVGELETASRQLGVDLQGRRVGDTTWLQHPTPFILLLSERHYVVVLSIDDTALLIADPAAGMFRLPRVLAGQVGPIAVLVARQ